jgi:hypothetical protein
MTMRFWPSTAAGGLTMDPKAKPDETLVVLYQMPAELKKWVDRCPSCNGTGSVKDSKDEWATCTVCKKSRELCDAWDDITT